MQVRRVQPKTVMQVGGVLVFIGIAAGSTLGTLPGLVLLVMGFISLQWGQKVLNRVNPYVHLEKRRAFPGEEIEGYTELVNFQPVPIPRLRFYLDWPPNLGSPQGKEVVLSQETTNYKIVQTFGLRWFERIKRRFAIPCRLRGDYTLGPVEMRAGDLFGFSEAHKKSEVRERFMVYPRQVPVNLIGSNSRSPFGNRSEASWIFEDPILFRGTRDYQSGDPYSRIEWKATARVGSLQSRVVDASFANEVGMVVNVSTTPFIWRIDRDLLEKNLIVAASLLPVILKGKYLFGIYSNGRIAGLSSTAGINVGSGPDHYRQCLEFLSRLLPGARTECAEVLSATSRKLGEKAHIIVFSGVITPELAGEIAALGRRGKRVTLVYCGDKPAGGYPPGLKGYQVMEGGRWDELENITLHPFSS